MRRPGFAVDTGVRPSPPWLSDAGRRCFTGLLRRRIRDGARWKAGQERCCYHGLSSPTTSSICDLLPLPPAVLIVRSSPAAMEVRQSLDLLLLVDLLYVVWLWLKLP